MQATACSTLSRTEGAGSRSGAGLKLLWLVPAVVALQFAAIYLATAVDSSEVLLRISLPVAHALLIPFLLANWRLWGIRLVAAGLALNLLVIVANGGLMPIEPAAVTAVGRHDVTTLEFGGHIAGTKNVLLAPNEANFAALSDRILLELGPLRKAISAGDFFVYGGAFVCLAEIAWLASFGRTAWRSVITALTR